MSLVYFITHPNVQIDPEVAVTDWSLSPEGSRRMHELLSLSWVQEITSVYSSAEKKAVQGANIIAEHLNMSFTEIPELGENDRSSTGYLPPSEFESMADLFFANPSRSMYGWESAESAQARIVGAINRLVHSEANDYSIAVVSHGAVGTLLLCHLNGWTIDRAHDQPGAGGGNYFCFEPGQAKVIHGWRSIDPDPR